MKQDCIIKQLFQMAPDANVIQINALSPLHNALAGYLHKAATSQTKPACVRHSCEKRSSRCWEPLHAASSCLLPTGAGHLPKRYAIRQAFIATFRLLVATAFGSFAQCCGPAVDERGYTNLASGCAPDERSDTELSEDCYASSDISITSPPCHLAF